MERIYRIIFLGLFILGFVGAIASANRTGNDGLAESPVISLIKDVRMAQEAEEINAGRWNQKTEPLSEDSLAKVEALFANQ